jgi:hypothetical protein
MSNPRLRRGLVATNVPDPMGVRGRDGIIRNDCCFDFSARADYVCTRREGHTGRHAANNHVGVIVAVWERVAR